MDDKAQHRLAGFCIAIVIADLLTLVGLASFLAGIIGLLAAVAAGAVKEWVYDAKRTDTHTVDSLDFWATVQGGTFGTIMFLAIQDLTERYTWTL